MEFATAYGVIAWCGDPLGAGGLSPSPAGVGVFYSSIAPGQAVPRIGAQILGKAYPYFTSVQG